MKRRHRYDPDIADTLSAERVLQKTEALIGRTNDGPIFVEKREPRWKGC